MKATTKKLLLATTVGATTAGLGLATLLFVKPKKNPQKALNKKREQVVKFISAHTGQNQKLIDIIYNLSESQIDNLAQMIKKVQKRNCQKNCKNQINGENVRDLTKKIIDTVADTLPKN